MGWEVKIYMSGQSNDYLRVCSAKMKKKLTEVETGHISANLQVMAWSIKWFELIFSKMLKLDEKDSLDPKMSHFDWFGEVFNFSMFNMFSWLYHIFLIYEVNSCLILMFEYSFQILGPTEYFCH